MAALVIEPEGIEFALSVAKAVSEMVFFETEGHTYTISRIVIDVDGMDQGLSLVTNDDQSGLDLSFSLEDC